MSINGVHYTSSSPPLRFLFIMGSPLDTANQADTACAYTGVDEVKGIGLLDEGGPPLGPVAGGTNVTIMGAYFMTLDDAALRCVFGAQQVNATILSFNEQRCFSPPLAVRAKGSNPKPDPDPNP